MKPTRIAALAAILLLLFASGLEAQVIDKPLGTVNLIRREVYTERQFKADIAAIEKSSGVKTTPEQRKLYLTSKLEEMLLLQGAERDKIVISDATLAKSIADKRASLGKPVTDAEFEELIKSQSGLTLAEYREKVRKQLVLIEYMKVKKKALYDGLKLPTEEEVRKAYEFNKIKFVRPDMVRFSFLYIETKGKTEAEKATLKALAEKIHAEIRANPSKFDEYVAKAADPSSPFKGGDGGYMLKQDEYLRIVGAKVFETVFTLRLGEISDLVYLEDKGYQIIKVTESYLQKTLDLSDPVTPGGSTTVAQSIYLQILNQRQSAIHKQAYAELVKELWVEADPADPKKAWTVKIEKFEFAY